MQSCHPSWRSMTALKSLAARCSAPPGPFSQVDRFMRRCLPFCRKSRPTLVDGLLERHPKSAAHPHARLARVGILVGDNVGKEDGVVGGEVPSELTRLVVLRATSA